MNRREFRALARLRVADARALLRARRWDGAYYLAGYAIECALKACIARTFQRGDIPEPNRVRDIYTHNVRALLRLAELERDLDTARRADAQLNIA